jgi:hypothetical protein
MGCVASALVAAVDVLLPVIGLAMLAFGSMTPVVLLLLLLLLSRVDLAGVWTDVKAASSKVCCLPPRFGSWGAVSSSAFTAPGCSGFC